MASRKFFRSSSSLRITAFLSTQEHQGHVPVLLQLENWLLQVVNGTPVLGITKVHWLMSKAKWMERCHHVMTHPSLGTRISEEALSFPYYDILWCFGPFLRSDNPVPCNQRFLRYFNQQSHNPSSVYLTIDWWFQLIFRKKHEIYNICHNCMQ